MPTKAQIIDEFAAVMLEGVKRATKKGWIPETATPKERVVTGIMHIVAHELGNVEDD